MKRPQRAAPPAGTRLPAGTAFVVNAGFVAGLLVLGQLSLLEQRPVVRASIVGAALFLLAWSVLLFGVLRRGQKVTLEIALRRQHYLQAFLQGALINPSEWGRALVPRQRHLAYMSVWALAFVGMSASGCRTLRRTPARTRARTPSPPGGDYRNARSIECQARYTPIWTRPHRAGRAPAEFNS